MQKPFCMHPQMLEIEKPAGPFSSWVKKTAGRFGRGPFSRAAKKDEVDDLLNSDAFLNKKVEMLQKQIKATQADIVTAQAQADEQWAEWGPQVSQANQRNVPRCPSWVAMRYKPAVRRCLPASVLVVHGTCDQIRDSQFRGA